MPAYIRFRPVAIAALVIALAGSVAPAPVGAERGDSSDRGKRDQARVQFLRRVSGASPFTEPCGDPGAHVDAEVEPHLAIDPQNPKHLLATWQQDRYPSGGARSNLVAASRNGGRSWTPALIPGLSACTDPDGDAPARASDPRAAIGADGRAYQASMQTEDILMDGLPVEFEGDVAVASSPGRGESWAPAVTVAADDDLLFHERPILAADPRRAGHAYVAWAQHVLPDPSPGGFATTLDVDTAFSRTEDGGQTWTEPTTIPLNVPVQLEEWPEEVLPLPREDGGTSIVVIYRTQPTRISSLGPFTFLSVHSEDLGETWSTPALIGTSPGLIPHGDAETVQEIRAVEAPRAAVAPDGSIWVTWHERTATGLPNAGADIHFAVSRDLGESWTSGEVGSFAHQAVTPTIAVAGDGTVGIFWYDQRRDVAGDDEMTTTIRFAASTDGGATWQEIDVTGPFDYFTAPQAGGLMLTDYEGMVGFPNGFGLLFAASQPLAQEGLSDIFFARIKFPGDDDDDG